MEGSPAVWGICRRQASQVAQELEISTAEARDRIRAVFVTIRQAISPGEFRDVLEQLDPEYADLLA